ncbi:MAG: hypothetical protein ABI586_03700 [Candidatus Nanopelagicales bacterium]
MARLALVSRNPVMSMGLSSTDHEIQEVRPSALADWLEAGGDADVDALVLDLGSAAVALNIVGDLRASARWTPILLVASDDVGWDSPEILALPGVDLLTLPIDSRRLQTATKGVLRHPAAPPAPTRTLSPPMLSTPLIDDIEMPNMVGEPSFLAEQPVERVAEEVLVPVEERSPIGRVTEDLQSPKPEQIEAQPASTSPAPVNSLAQAPATPIPIRAIDVDPVAQPKARQAKKPTTAVAPLPEAEPTVNSDPAQKKSRRALRMNESTLPDQGMAELTKPSKPKAKRSHREKSATNPSQPLSNSRPDGGLGEPTPHELITILLASVGRLYTLAETADVVVADAVKRAAADSGALLVPDAGAWRVAAGLGLRPLEYRYQLTADSWLVERVSEAGRGILIQDSDVARKHLHGAPLASRAHLLAVPVPGVGAILLLSRDQAPPFTETVLGELAHLAQEAQPLIQRAVGIRSLARELGRHTDPVDAPRD